MTEKTVATDVVYFLANSESHPGSHYEDAELRYSLRSLAKHGRGVGRVWVIGAIPQFALDNHWPYSRC